MMCSTLQTSSPYTISSIFSSFYNWSWYVHLKFPLCQCNALVNCFTLAPLQSPPPHLQSVISFSLTFISLHYTDASIISIPICCSSNFWPTLVSSQAGVDFCFVITTMAFSRTLIWCFTPANELSWLGIFFAMTTFLQICMTKGLNIDIIFHYLLNVFIGKLNR